VAALLSAAVVRSPDLLRLSDTPLTPSPQGGQQQQQQQAQATTQAVLSAVLGSITGQLHALQQLLPEAAELQQRGSAAR
jgi:hypothetical protein